MTDAYTSRIVRDPKVAGGRPIIKGSRIRIKAILDNLAANRSMQDILGSYSSLTAEDVQAVIAFAGAGCRSSGTTPQMGRESRTNVNFHERSICRNPIGSTVSSSRRDTSH